MTTMKAVIGEVLGRHYSFSPDWPNRSPSFPVQVKDKPRARQESEWATNQIGVCGR